MAKQVKFSSLAIGARFFAEGGNGYEEYKKVSSLEYESVRNSILGSFYTTPGFMVDLENKLVAKKSVKKPVKKAVKKPAKKAAKR